MERFPLLPRDRAFLVIMLAGFESLNQYVRIEGDYRAITIDTEAAALSGSGVRFLVAAFLSLYRREPCVLADMAHLDPRNRRLFILALEAWLMEEGG